MNDFLNKNKIRLVILAIAVVVLLTSVSFAYFTATVSGNQTNSNVVTSGVMEVSFEDGQLIGTPTDMIPGQSITKSFTVTNTGNVDSEYVIYLSEVVNDFNPTSDLEYKLEKLSDDGYTKDFTECPTSPVAINDVPIAIGVGQTHSYKLTIRFKETNASQDTNKGKQFKARIQINEYSNAPETISGIITDQGGNPIANQAMVAFSNPVYFTTDSNGHYEITLPGGNHNIYFIPGVSEQELRSLGESVKNSSDVKTVAIDTHITDNITFNNYHLKKTITIHPDNGSSNYTVERELDVALGSLVEPTKSNYIFTGWYSDSQLTKEVTQATIVTNSLTDIYAKYISAVTTITIHTNNNQSNYTVNKRLDSSLGVLDEPTRTNYEFMGWYSDSSFNNEVNSNTIVSLQLTDIYAKWKKVLNLATFDKYVYLDAKNGNDTTGTGTSAKPFKTLNALSNTGVIEAGYSYGIILKDGTYDFSNYAVLFSTACDKSLTLIGNREKTKIVVGAMIGNTSASVGSKKYTVTFERLILEHNNVSWYGWFVGGAGLYVFNNVVINVNGSTSNPYFYDAYPDLTNCTIIGNHKYLVCQRYRVTNLKNNYGNMTWDKISTVEPNLQTNYITATPHYNSTNYRLTDSESLWKNVGTGTNPDGTTANLGVYGGTLSWEFKDNIFY